MQLNLPSTKTNSSVSTATIHPTQPAIIGIECSSCPMSCERPVTGLNVVLQIFFIVMGIVMLLLLLETL